MGAKVGCCRLWGQSSGGEGGGRGPLSGIPSPLFGIPSPLSGIP